MRQGESDGSAGGSRKQAFARSLFHVKHRPDVPRETARHTTGAVNSCRRRLREAGRAGTRCHVAGGAPRPRRDRIDWLVRYPDVISVAAPVRGASLPGGRVLVRRFHVKHPVGDVDAGSAVPRSSTADVPERVPRAPSLPWREFTLPGSRRHVAMRQPPPARGNAPSGRR